MTHAPRADESAGAVASMRVTRTRAPRVRPWILIAAVTLAVAGAATLQIFMAREHLLRGARDVGAATSEGAVMSNLREPSARARIRADLQNARSELETTREDLRLWSPLLARLSWLPVIGSQIAAAPPAADAAYYATDAAVNLSDGLAPLWSLLDKPSHQRLLGRVAAELSAHRRQFLAAGVDAGRVSRAVSLLPGSSGNPTLDQEGMRLRRDLPVLRATSVWLAAAPTVLGVSRPSRYLVAIEDQTELRATGGFIAAADFITLRHGSISSRFTGSALPHEIQSVLVPLPEALYTPETRWTFRDSNWSPDFPLSARLERWFYGEDTSRWADGVIDVTDNGVVDVLRGTGPIYLPAYQRWVDSTNVLALAREYASGESTGASPTSTRDAQRKRFLGLVMGALLQQFQTLQLQHWQAFSAAFMTAAATGDLLVYDRRPAIESAIKSVHADGNMPRPRGDYLYIVDDNRSYNKINPYVHEWVTYNVGIRPDLWLDSTVTIHYRLAPSPAGLEGFGPGYGMWGTKHDYQDFLRVYVPAGARLQSASGLQSWAPAAAYGLTQFAGRILLREGRSATVTIRYTVPERVFATSGSKRYILTVQHQPGSNVSGLHVTVRGLPGIHMASRHGRPMSSFAVRLPKRRDGRVDVIIQGGAGRQEGARAPLPAVPDPYIPFDYLRDPKHQL